MTSIKEIKNILLALIPDEMKSDDLVSDDIVKVGAMDMATRINLEEFDFIEEVGVDGVEETFISPTLTFQQKRLASYMAYGLYLEKLQLLYTNDAINFSTLTFSIKGLEKRPEAIDGAIYKNKRYVSDLINSTNGTDSIVGTVVKFGG